MYVYIYVCIYIYVYIYMYVYIYIYICVCVCVCVCKYLDRQIDHKIYIKCHNINKSESLLNYALCLGPIWC